MRKIFYLSLIGLTLQRTLVNQVIQHKSQNKGIGINNVCKGQGNRWIGNGNLMLGKYNAVDGFHNQVNGGTNVIRGKVNMVNGKQNMIEGEQNTISGENNLVIGSGNVVSNDLSFLDFDNEINKRFAVNKLNSQQISRSNALKNKYFSQIKQNPIKQRIYSNIKPLTQKNYKPIIYSDSPVKTVSIRSPVKTSPIISSKQIKKPIIQKQSILKGIDLRSQIQNQIQNRLKQTFSRAGIYRY